MANEFYISAGLPPIDNSSGATSNAFYISAGLPPVDTAADDPVPIVNSAWEVYAPRAVAIDNPTQWAWKAYGLTFSILGHTYESGVAVACTVRTYNRATGALVLETTSDGSGAYTVTVPHMGLYYLVAINDDANEFEALIQDRITPDAADA